MSTSGERERPSAASLAKAFVAVVVFAAALFLSAGTWKWLMGWVWVGIAGASTLIVSLLADPALLKQRTQVEQAGAERWDIPLALIVGRIGPMAMLLVAGLDRRFGWSSPTPPALFILAFALLAAGYIVSDWAVIVNRFFTPVVQIQREQGHTVVTDGPYRWVRHPGYAGALLVYGATPLLLGSWWALIPAAITDLIVVIRTALEDRALRERLPGYGEYAARVHWRLVPGVW